MTTTDAAPQLPQSLEWLWDGSDQSQRQATDHLLGLAPTRSPSPDLSAFALHSAARRRAADAGMTYADFDAAISRTRQQWGATSEVEAVRACLHAAMADPGSPVFGVAPADAIAAHLRREHGGRSLPGSAAAAMVRAALEATPRPRTIGATRIHTGGLLIATDAIVPSLTGSPHRSTPAIGEALASAAQTANLGTGLFATARGDEAVSMDVVHTSDLHRALADRGEDTWMGGRLTICDDWLDPVLSCDFTEIQHLARALPAAPLAHLVAAGSPHAHHNPDAGLLYHTDLPRDLAIRTALAANPSAIGRFRDGLAGPSQLHDLVRATFPDATLPDLDAATDTDLGAALAGPAIFTPETRGSRQVGRAPRPQKRTAATR